MTDPDKRDELIVLAQQALQNAYGPVDAADVHAFIDELCRITPPEAPPPTTELITLRPGGGGGARSVKPGNVMLNLRKLAVALAGGTLTVSGVLATPWAYMFAALVVWDSTWSCLEANLDESSAAVAWAMWKHADESRTVNKADLYELVNQERQLFGAPSISTRQFQEAIRTLKAMRCIQSSKQQPDRWWLREWVKIKYR